MRKIAEVLGILLSIFLILRAIVELFTIDFGDPATYQDDWGGPSLAGVLLVHCGPGIVAAVLIGRLLVRRLRR